MFRENRGSFDTHAEISLFTGCLCDQVAALLRSRESTISLNSFYFYCRIVLLLPSMKTSMKSAKLLFIKVQHIVLIPHADT